MVFTLTVISHDSTMTNHVLTHVQPLLTIINHFCGFWIRKVLRHRWPSPPVNTSSATSRSGGSAAGGRSTNKRKGDP